jgi:hypothetical protein
MEEGALAVVSWDCFCWPRQKLALGWCIAIKLKNKFISCKKDFFKKERSVGQDIKWPGDGV